MNKILIVLVLILLVIVVIVLPKYFIIQNKVEKQQQELDVATKYIQQLNQKLRSIPQEKLKQTSDPDKIRDLLDGYLKEKRIEDKIPVLDKISQQKDEKRFIPDLVPVQGNFALSQKFSEKHKAVDFAAPTGTEVVASAAGEILSVYYDKYFGNVMIIDHLNEYATLYAHLATSIYEAKTFVEKGETIALVGNTGNSTAPHLHFEILVNGENIDPEKILNIK
jgi:murein DD-endopeptidase MepM/ murein hydrolase activator NlpD